MGQDKTRFRETHKRNKRVLVHPVGDGMARGVDDSGQGGESGDGGGMVDHWGSSIDAWSSHDLMVGDWMGDLMVDNWGSNG